MSMWKSSKFAKEFASNGHQSLKLLRLVRRRIASSARCAASEDSVVKRESDYYLKKIPKKLPAQPPFLKNFFINILEKSMFIHPEVLPKAQYNEMVSNEISTMDFIMSNEVNSTEMDKTREIPLNVHQAIKDLGLFATQVPEEYGGLDFNVTASLKIAEVLAGDTTLLNIVKNQHHMAIKLLLCYGSDAQKKFFLPKMVMGDLKASICVYDNPEGLSIVDEATRATRSQDGDDQYILSGKKVLVPADHADYYFVLARTQPMENIETLHNSFSWFIVDASDPNVKKEEHEERLGYRASKLCTLTLDNVKTTHEAGSLVGKWGAAEPMLRVVMQEARLLPSLNCIVILRELANVMAMKSAVDEQFGLKTGKFGYMHQQYGSMACDLYCMESMVYYTAGILDTFENPDVHLESLACQIFCTERVMKYLLEFFPYLQLSGTPEEVATYGRHIRDRISAPLHEGRLDVLKTEFAYSGLQFAGEKKAKQIRVLRNPMVYPEEILKNAYQRLTGSKYRKDAWNTEDWFHPTFIKEGEDLSYSIQDFSHIVQKQFVAVGADTLAPAFQGRCCALTDIGVRLFAMSSILTRCSRTHSLGHPHSDVEKNICLTAMMKLTDQVKYDMLNMQRSMELDDIPLIASISNELFRLKGYKIKHPTFKYLF